MTVEKSSKRPLRADAARNQARILESAQAVFGAKGLGVSLDEIAHHAGLGVGTLYRRFPDRESIVMTLFELELRRCVALANAALATADPWEGFTTLLRSILSSVATDKGMRQALLSSRYGLGAATASKDELVRLLSLVIQRAQDHGSLRLGITASDIPITVLMVGVVADFSFNANPILWERYFGLLIDGMSAHKNLSAMKPDALTEGQMALASSLW